MNKKWLSLLGLAVRARMLVSGEEMVLKEVRRNKMRLVILSTDASEGTKKKVSDKCNFYKVPLHVIGTREELGRAIGKEERVVIGVVDPGFAKKLVTLIEQ
jgi:ribosomal protein L7Ae-like RNA K-turn-binding protein